MNSSARPPLVEITNSALETIAREASLSLDGLETGGILLGTDQPERLIIRHAGGPGPLAQRSPNTFSRDLAHAQSIADIAWEKDRSVWIGEWHTHPAGDLTPSPLDLNSYTQHLNDPDLGLHHFVAIVAGFDVQSRVVAQTWIVDRYRAELVIPVRHAPNHDSHTQDRFGS